ncbi:hypothetical protein JCM10908_002627 [Rhodotorula pacifica]|uniref:Fet4p n=1 Tax=Rhodotorula pacifica TaxID=1495444 RepID=UPI003175268A
MFPRLLTAFAAPGARHALHVSAPNASDARLATDEPAKDQPVAVFALGAASERDSAEEKSSRASPHMPGYDLEKAMPTCDFPLINSEPGSTAIGAVARAVKPTGRLDQWLDVVVGWAGSPGFFLLVSSGLIAWAILGAVGYGSNTDWNVLISDIQAIATYVLDSFLLRQQMAAHRDVLVATAILRSRAETIQSMLQQVTLERGVVGETRCTAVVHGNAGLPEDTRFGKAAKVLSDIAGHFCTIVLFWIGIGVWLAFGPSLSWSPAWQLYMNSSSSALMLFVFAFLCCVRKGHGEYVRICLDKIERTDEDLELRLRRLTGDKQAHPTVLVPAPQVSRVERVINYYADFVGSLVGVGFLLAVLVVWAALGPAFHFDATWWLLSGTYAGLIGMQDGFVMRNTAAQFQRREAAELERLAEADLAREAAAGAGTVIPPTATCSDVASGRLRRIFGAADRLALRASLAVGHACSHQYAVVASIIVLVILVAAATALRWSLTGQLLCNVPPSIIESWMMLMVIQGHNENDAQTRANLAAILDRRRILLARVNCIGMSACTPPPSNPLVAVEKCPVNV